MVLLPFYAGFDFGAGRPMRKSLFYAPPPVFTLAISPMVRPIAGGTWSRVGVLPRRARGPCKDGFGYGI